MERYSGLTGAVQTLIQSLLKGDDPNCVPLSSGRPIILIHGFGTSSRILLPLERSLHRTLQRPIIRLRLGERIPLHIQDIRASAQRVHAVLHTIAKSADFEYADVVGHSMGGLVAAYLLKRLDHGRHIRSVVTLGTPHRGAPLAVLGVLLFGAITRAVWQMLPGSSLVRELEELPVPAGSRMLSIAAWGDSVVPPGFAQLRDFPRQENICLPELDHFALLHSSAAVGAVARALADTSRELRKAA